MRNRMLPQQPDKFFAFGYRRSGMFECCHQYFMTQIQKFLSARLAGILCVMFSILAINSIQLTTVNLGWDNSFSIAAAKSISEGHGFSIKLASSRDISKTYYEPLIKWPPGYSLLLVMVHATGLFDWILSAFLLNAAGLTLLVLLFKRLLVQLEYPLWIIHPAVLYFGFVFHFYTGIYFTDIFALLFFMTGCSLLLQYVKRGQKAFYLIVLSAVCFAFSAWQKYLYFGLAFIPFISFFFFGWRKNLKKIRLASGVGILVTGFLITLLIYFQFRNAGQILYIKPSSRTGFFPFQVLQMAPIVPGTFLNLDFVNMQISGHLPVSYQNMYTLWSVANFICLVFLVYVSWPVIRDPQFFKKDFWNFYKKMSLWTSVYLFIFLIALTVHYNSHYEDMKNPWVFVGIPRYFAPFCFLLFPFFAFLFLKPNLFPNKFSFYLFRVLVLCIMAEEISHGAYFIIKQIFVHKEFGIQRHADQVELHSYNLVKSERAKNEIVVCAGIPEISNFSSLTGTSSIMDPQVFKKPIYSSKDVLIITTLDSFSASKMPVEFFKMDTRLVEQENGYSYYFTRIRANNP